jgi:hypothetical protein
VQDVSRRRHHSRKQATVLPNDPERRPYSVPDACRDFRAHSSPAPPMRVALPTPISSPRAR